MTSETRKHDVKLDLGILEKQLHRLAANAMAVDSDTGRMMGFSRGADGLALKVGEELGELYQAYLLHTGRRQQPHPASDDFILEVARQASDVLIFLLMFCREANVPLIEGLKQKWLPLIRDVTGPREARSL